MEQLAAVGLDLVAIAILAFAMYFPRHRRRDLAVAFVGINVGVLAVSIVLGSTTVGAGLGLGLFGVLSIIRLRSSEIEQSEIAYYFAALALGLIAGLSSGLTWLDVVLMALILVALALIDSPALFRRYREQRLTLDRAYTDESTLRAVVAQTLGARIHVVHVREINLVSDTTIVDVRYAVVKNPKRDAAPVDTRTLTQFGTGR